MGQKLFFLLGFPRRERSPSPVGLAFLVNGEVFSLSSWCVGLRQSAIATREFMRSIITSIFALLVTSICLICFACWSCIIAKSIAWVSPSFLVAAVLCASSTASLNCDCFVLVAKFCFRSSHFSVKYAWSSAYICWAVVLFSQTAIWPSVNILDCHICAPAAIVFSASLVMMPWLPSDTWKQSSSTTYAVMLVVGSQGVLYPFILYSCFCAVVILIAVLRHMWSIITSTVVLPKLMYCFLTGQRFCHGEYSTDLVLKFVPGLWGDCAIEVCQLVMEADECVVRVWWRSHWCFWIDRLDLLTTKPKNYHCSRCKGW